MRPRRQCVLLDLKAGPWPGPLEAGRCPGSDPACRFLVSAPRITLVMMRLTARARFSSPEALAKGQCVTRSGIRTLDSPPRWSSMQFAL